jgi:hypothetical protein
MMLSQISVWRLFASFSGATMMTVKEDGRCFGEAHISPRVNL